MEVVIKPGSLVMSDAEIQNYKDYVTDKHPGAAGMTPSGMKSTTE